MARYEIVSMIKFEFYSIIKSERVRNDAFVGVHCLDRAGQPVTGKPWTSVVRRAEQIIVEEQYSDGDDIEMLRKYVTRVNDFIGADGVKANTMPMVAVSYLLDNGYISEDEFVPILFREQRVAAVLNLQTEVEAVPDRGKKVNPHRRKLVPKEVAEVDIFTLNRSGDVLTIVTDDLREQLEQHCPKWTMAFAGIGQASQ